ncbi:probable thiopurine S-methyltransferase [Amphibalanus amphitrite]|uniref:probable thiopurine S-methyltransferase n=1 Tax=Amphibalanus amphitrite TaxID=1232801 RepID=UPI001C8FDCF2|nr:probable thiopurine S-methyltransferase [Amphibalanus amphitrite]XP_043203536.1 probable thiopurine S-methyltransferase [Amphibalanus amphitrite]XP_043203538.1 probable thiopurine S-methyltransferase [Amphibalanus amphitrite]XP_043203539.1 probable thiopurine S-methyltransferase [Amphibalanus amphitrite]XP_043203540.1 probable thiopurine S-methyltransferase [Amphibalanus amphitrite]XP_043203541.1 probable thiopurine S-methyltransferase [Amphibalanus amphitrite]XP_043203542.1 probable thiop
MAGEMDKERVGSWEQKWSEGKINFHKQEVHPDLKRWYDKLVPDDRPRTVLVPLCGKSVDMMWLHSKGHTVIGIECAEKAILDFFAENKLDFTTSSVPEATLYQTADGRLRLYRADICRLSGETIGAVDGIWDRASYVAMNVEDRPKYAALLRSVMAPGCRYLLSTVEYGPCEFRGTPRSVTPADFRPEFESVADIEHMYSHPQPDDLPPGLLRCSPAGLQENLYLIVRR